MNNELKLKIQNEKMHKIIKPLRENPSVENIALEIEFFRVARPDRDIQYRLEAARLFGLLGVSTRTEYDVLIKSLLSKMIGVKQEKSNDIIIKELITEEV